MRRKGLILLSCVIALAVLVTGCGGSGSTSSAANAAATSHGTSKSSGGTLSVGYFSNPNPEKIAMKEGWFNQALGLNVAWHSFASGADMMTGLISGAIDIGCEVGIPPVVSAVANGAPLAFIWIEKPVEGLAVRPSAHIASAAQLAGKKIGTIPGSSDYFLLAATAEKSGVTLGKVNVVTGGVPDIVAAYQRGDLDGVFLPYPGLSTVVKSGATLLLNSLQIEKMWGYPDLEGCVVDRNWASSHASLLTKWVGVENRAVNYLASNPTAAYSAIGAEVGESASQAKEDLSHYVFATAAQQLSQDWLGTPANHATSAAAEAIAKTGALEASLHAISTAPSNAGAVSAPQYIAAAAK
jgi:taurine transport system substrate-binding protein